MSMRIGAIIQARMTSRRLPGKVLLELAGKPILQRVVERVQAAPGIDAVAVATSVDASDDAIAKLCKSMHVRCVRGSLDNVAERLTCAAETLGLDALVRVCADSPLIDTELVNEAAARMRRSGEGDGGADLVTNVSPRTFPKGQSVEVIRTSALRAALELMDDPLEREHVTLHFYRRPARFRVERIVSPMEVTDVSMAVDEAPDLLRLEELFAVAAHAAEEGGWVELVRQLRLLGGARMLEANAAPACCASA